MNSIKRAFSTGVTRLTITKIKTLRISADVKGFRAVLVAETDAGLHMMRYDKQFEDAAASKESVIRWDQPAPDMWAIQEQNEDENQGDKK